MIYCAMDSKFETQLNKQLFAAIPPWLYVYYKTGFVYLKVTFEK